MNCAPEEGVHAVHLIVSSWYI